MNGNPNPFALIVEDDPDAAAIFAEALKAAAPFQVKIIGTGDKALEWLAKHEPDMVVLDMHLPKVAGPEILRYIRAQAQDKTIATKRLVNTKVIVATADPSTAETLYDIADLVLLKPISFSQLRDLAKRLINTPSSDEML
ncbi:MAG: response regulator [Chloroflexi bacterium]|nr:response regulator [Chloroflexota bacterium]